MESQCGFVCGLEMTSVCKGDRGSCLSADSQQPVAAPRLFLDKPVWFFVCDGGVGRRRRVSKGDPPEEPVFLAEVGHVNSTFSHSSVVQVHAVPLGGKGSLVVTRSRSHPSGFLSLRAVVRTVLPEVLRGTCPAVRAVHALAFSALVLS